MSSDNFGAIEVLQRLIYWEQPIVTSIVFLLLHLIFWYLLNVEWRFYGVFFGLCLTYFICNEFVDYKRKTYEESNVQTTSKYTLVVTFISGLIQFLKIYRNRHPNMFCFYTIGMLILIRLFGLYVSTLTFLYCMLVILPFSIPFIEYVIPKQTKDLISSFNQHIRTIRQSVEMNEELIPEEDDLLPFEAKDDASSYNNDDLESVQDSISSSCLISGINQMPCHEETSLDGLDDIYMELESKLKQNEVTNLDSTDESDNEVAVLQQQFLETSSNSSVISNESSHNLLLKEIDEVDKDVQLVEQLDKDEQQKQPKKNNSFISISLKSSSTSSRSRNGSSESCSSDFEFIDSQS